MSKVKALDAEKERRFQDIVKYFTAKDFEQVVELGKKFTKDFADNGAGWNLLALGYKNTGNVEKAIRIFKAMIKSAPKTAMYHSNLGNAYTAIGKIRQGITCFKQALKLEPSAINAIEALGLAYLEINKTGDAIKCFKRVVKLDPNNKASLYYLANIYLTDRNWEKARRYLPKTSHRLSKSHYLECLLALEEKEEFFSKYQELSSEGIVDPLIGSVISHGEQLFGVPINNTFCNNSLDHIYLGRIGSEDGFSDELAQQLIDFHHSNKNDYRSQNLLKNGFQSSGNLFLLKEPFVPELMLAIEHQIERYRQNFQTSGQGFLTLWPEKYSLFGWMVSINSEGNLDAHMHKEGWLSGSFYLSLPETEAASDDGKIAFSLCGPRYPAGDTVFEKRVLDIKQRDICMFPSSIFHETIPFKGEKERISFAFDVIPDL